MTEQTVTHILVVDDDFQVRASVGRLLCDIHMPGGSGFMLVREAVTASGARGADADR